MSGSARFSGPPSGTTTQFLWTILETYSGFEGLKSLVDVGGGNGSILNMIVSKYPFINGINFDLAPVIEKSPSYPGMGHISYLLLGHTVQFNPK